MVPSSTIAKLVVQHELFRGFPKEVINLVINQSKIRQLHAGEVLIHSGTTNHSLFLVLDGELKVIIQKANTQVAIPIKPGECLGEMSLVEERPTSATAVCHLDSQVLVISEDVFWTHLAISRQGVKNLMGIMAERLHRNNQALIKEMEEQLKYKQLEKDFQTAGNIQANIVPNGAHLFPQRPEIEVYARTQQARAVGGDFYDAIALDQDRIYLAIGDATGKGMPAALFMMRAFTSLRFLVSNCSDLSEVLPALNKTLLKKNDDMMFVSLWVGVLDLKTSVLTYVNGGHHPPFAALRGGTFQPLEVPNGPIVGVVEEAQFEVATMQITPGDTFFLYTDGLPEAYNMNNVAFEADRIKASLNSLKDPTMQSLICDLETEVANFVDGAPTHDDLTMLAFRYVGEDSVEKGK
ncbi:SpoIIE family protein phosphatase [Lewinella cohaerens]|uniref:SpoIIE family protein phosphatase n=1 Tax=Lewinella cohaerens TaxID=70995 RepID=UPI000366B149|nr:SpoIIE family protein phosphatase [Lewinella cohaerens]